MINRAIKTGAFCLIVFFSWSAIAQEKPDPKVLMQEYTGEEAVIINLSHHLDIRMESGKPKIITNRKTEVLYLTDKANRYLNQSITFCDKFTNITDINAATWIPGENGSKMKRIEVEHIYTRKAVSEHVFYDDLQEKYFTYPSLRKGAVSELNYSEEILDPHFLPTVFLGSYIPVVNGEFIISHPPDVKVKYLVKDPDGLISRHDTRTKSKIITTFRTIRTAGHPIEEDSPEGSHFLPHVVAYIDSYETNGKETKVLTDVQSLYGWYQSLLVQMTDDAGSELAQLADSLKNISANQEENIKNVFYWVQEHIRYIAIEDGLGGFIPRGPNITLNNKYGDCKDKATLINSLLTHSGIEAHHAWIGTRDIPYRYEELPTPQVDNHMISAVKFNGQWQFLDGTATHIKYGMPTFMIQGKEAMIGISKDSYEIAVVPEFPAEASAFQQNLSISLRDGKISGTGVSKYTGYFKEEFFETLAHVGEGKRNDNLRRSINLCNGKYSASNITEMPGFDDRDSVLAYSYEFTLDDYVTHAENLLLVNMNLNRPEGYDKIEMDKRKTNKVIDYKNVEILNVSFEIPTGYRVKRLPPSRNCIDNRFSYSITYNYTGNRVSLRREAVLNTLLVKKSDFEAWNEFAGGLNESGKDILVLEKIK